jgi:hypothetical protein
MFNCKKLFKLQIRPQPNPVDYYILGYVNICQPKLRSEKFNDDDDDDDNNNDNNYCILPPPRKFFSFFDCFRDQKTKQLACSVAGFERSEGTDTTCSWTGG